MSKKGEPEVLIIPPNLLEKFGLSLKNIPSSQEGPSTILKNNTKLNAEHNITGTKEINDNKALQHAIFNTVKDIKETSILETANLMKESVFLSPTFIPTVANVIPGEIEITDVSDKECNIAEINIENSKAMVDDIAKNDNVTNLDFVEKTIGILNLYENNKPIAVNKSYDETDGPYINSTNTCTIDKCSTSRDNQNVSNEDLLISNTNSCNNILENEVVIHRDFKNINLTKDFKQMNDKQETVAELNPDNVSTNTIIKSNSSKLETHRNTKNKIKIISEEVLNFEIRPDYEVTKSPHRNNLVWVTMDTIIATRNKNIPLQNTCKSEHKYEPTDEKPSRNVVPESNTFMEDKAEYSQNANNQSINITVNELFGNNEKFTLDSTHSYSNSEKRTLYSSNVNIDSVIICNKATNVEENSATINYDLNKMLTADLSQSLINNDGSKISKNIKSTMFYESLDDVTIPGAQCTNYDSVKYRRGEEASCASLPIRASNVDKVKNNIIGQAKIKMCVQGIEKPGGNIEFKKSSCLKTYLPKKIKSKKNENKCESDLNLQISKYVDVNTIDYAINELNLNMSRKYSDYCLCDDFGKMIIYNDCPYEHIHFWHTKAFSSDPSVIYGIYYDNVIHTFQEVLDETGDLKSEKEVPNICWNGIYGHDILTNSKDINGVQECTSKLCSLVIEPVNETNKIAKILKSESIKKTFQNNNSDDNFDKNVHTASLREPTTKNAVDVGNISVLDNTIFSEGQDIGVKNRKIIKSVCSDSDVVELNLVPKTVNDEKSINASNLDSGSNMGLNSPIFKREPESNLTNIKQIKLMSPKKVYSSLTKSGKRSFNDGSLGIMPEHGGKKVCHGQKNEHVPTEAEKPEPVLLRCGLCGQLLQNTEWHIHMYNVHLNWDVTHKDLEDDDIIEKVNDELTKKLNADGILKCEFCIFKVNHIPTLILHVQQCIQQLSHTNLIVSPSNCKFVTCGVCKKSIASDSWIPHIRISHNYLAWQEGKTALDLTDDEAVRQHLYKYKNRGALKCNCGREDKYVGLFMAHIRTCDPKAVKSANAQFGTDDEAASGNSNSHLCSEVPHTERSVSVDEVTSTDPEYVECGACKARVDACQWFSHIQTYHDYLAWKTGDRPLDTESSSEVLQHLKMILLKEKILICSKCGLTRKYAKSFQNHIRKCDGMTLNKTATLKADKTLSSDISQLDDSQESDLSLHKTAKRARHILNQTTTLNADTKPSSDISQLDDRQEGDLSLHKTAERADLILNQTATLKADTTPSSDISQLDEGQEGDLNLNKTAKRADLILNQTATLNADTKPSSDISQLDDRQEGDLSLHKTAERADFILNQTATLKADTTPSSDISQLDEGQEGDLSLNKTAKRADLILNQTDTLKADSTPSSDISQLDDSQEGDLSLHKTAKRLVLNQTDTLKPDTTLTSDISQLDDSQEEDLSLHKTAKRARLQSSSSDIEDDQSLLSLSNKKIVECGVCAEKLPKKDWIEHIAKHHDYLAWEVGEAPLDLNDEECVRQHLNKLSRKIDGLLCPKCGSKRKYIKAYLEHVRVCTGKDLLNVIDSRVEELPKTDIDKKNITCGVCKQVMQKSLWITHIESEHNYLAWKDGQRPLNFDDDEVVRNHLYKLSHKLNGLVCVKCKCVRKYAKNYLEHIKHCREPKSVRADESTSSIEEVDDTIVKCGICNEEMQGSLWITHIENKHNYLAWKDGETVLDLHDEEMTRLHLHQLSHKLNGLTCFKCKCVRKYAKNYLEHIKHCQTPSSEEPVESKIVIPKSTEKMVKCGVCQLEVNSSSWYSHIGKNHNYLAWIEGEPALTLDDEEEVHQHLYKLTKKLNGLVCAKCRASRKYVKSYLHHIKNCTSVVSDSEDSPMTSNIYDIEMGGKCGVCAKDIENGNWIKHIQVAHNYLAWREGENPFDINDDDAVRTHLSNIVKSVPSLICAKCGFTRRKVAYYLSHIRTCDIGNESSVCEDRDSLLLKNEGMLECAVCHEKVLPNKWDRHAMDKHYNIAWAVGDIPINLKVPYAADRYLRKYKDKKGKLVCNNCGESRTSLMGFFVHIITCGKTDEETEMYKDKCDICGKLYLGVYRSQHMTMHKEQERARERKDMIDETCPEVKEEPVVSGRRKAAQKATSVIEQYNSDLNNHKYKCNNCDFGADEEVLFGYHKCQVDTEVDAMSDDNEKEDSSYDSSNCSDQMEEEELECPPPKKKYIEIPKKSWVPFKVQNSKLYLAKTAQNFCTLHFAEETLFADWRVSKYELIEAEEEINKYTPKLSESCQVWLNHDTTTYNRFEGKYIKRVHSMFVGGTIQCMSWAPTLKVECDSDKHYLAVVSHLDDDLPRLNYDEVTQHRGLIQIWDVGDLRSDLPKFTMGIAHDYGTVWAMNWCPSGTRDSLIADSEDKKWARLGLLAIACSNGFVYILSVPYPESLPNSSEILYLRLQPVAELRFKMKNESKSYQATSLTWSKKKGHTIIVVGYGDGHIASFDLTNESPLLKSIDGDVSVFYPYNDERLLNSCVTAMDSFPAQGEVGDAVCAGSPTGAVLAGPGGRMVSRLSASYAAFAPGMPVAIFGGDEGVVHQSHNELEWHGGARRLGPLRVGTGCNHCGMVLMFTPPQLRVTRLFPPCVDVNKKVVGVLNIKSLTQKRQKYRIDELSTKVEPRTYDEAIQRYGIEFMTGNFKSAVIPKESYPERFPLADVTSLAYCPSGKCHEAAAVATHAGVIFIFKTQ